MSAEPRERRLVLRILAYWRGVRGDRAFPAPAEIRDEGLGQDLEFCLRLSLPAGAADPMIARLGAHYAAESPALCGRPVSACPPGTIISATAALARDVLAQRVPITVGGEATHRGGLVLFRSILLPLSTDGARIDAFLGAANYRAAEGSGAQPTG